MSRVLPLAVHIETSHQDVEAVDLRWRPEGFIYHVLGNGSADLRRSIQKFIEGYLHGKPTPLPRLNLKKVSPFTLRVLCSLETIPFGKTKSYSEVAAAVGRPKAFRSVGSACG